MKVVLFCGGRGLRLTAASRGRPKPMVAIGRRPILWHIMKYYAYFGHTDFVLCLGYRGEMVRSYFAKCDGFRSEGWNVSFVDSGLDASVGERLRAARPHLEGEELFLANYADTLTDAPLPCVIDRVESTGKTAAFLCVRPSYTFHVVSIGSDDLVDRLVNVADADIWINGGYFVFRSRIFDYLHEGEDLVDEPFARLARDGELVGYPYQGFWLPMDTLKEKQRLDALAGNGGAAWKVWDTQSLVAQGAR